MTKALRNWRTSRDTREIVRVESNEVERLPQRWIDEIQALRKEWEQFKNSPSFVLPKVLMEFSERLKALEEQPTNITPSDVSKDDVETLANAVTEAGETALRFTKNAAVLVKRMDAAEARSAQVEELALALERIVTALETRVAEMPDAILQEFRAARAEQSG